jgi:hypothetical protein
VTRYTKPKLRERLKKEIQASDKGGRPGQWSARKAQLLAQEYKARGGEYAGKKDERSKHLDKWTKQKWETREGSASADTGRSMHRYLPHRAWQLLSEEQQDATERRKEGGDGKQFVSNTPPARAARAYVDHGDATLLDDWQLRRLSRSELLQLARAYDIRGRSHMNKDAMADSLHKGFLEANSGMKKADLQKQARAYGVPQSQRKLALIHDIVHAVSQKG